MATNLITAAKLKLIREEEIAFRERVLLDRSATDAEKAFSENRIADLDHLTDEQYATDQDLVLVDDATYAAEAFHDFNYVGSVHHY